MEHLNDYARGAVALLRGGSVTDDNYRRIVAETGITQFHSIYSVNKKSPPQSAKLDP
jgi:copper homeostasis protein CutC